MSAIVRNSMSPDSSLGTALGHCHIGEDGIGSGPQPAPEKGLGDETALAVDIAEFRERGLEPGPEPSFLPGDIHRRLPASG